MPETLGLSFCRHHRQLQRVVQRQNVVRKEILSFSHQAI
jgi:hypothetical protein